MRSETNLIHIKKPGKLSEFEQRKIYRNILFFEGFQVNQALEIDVQKKLNRVRKSQYQDDLIGVFFPSESVFAGITPIMNLQ